MRGKPSFAILNEIVTDICPSSDVPFRHVGTLLSSEKEFKTDLSIEMCVMKGGECTGVIGDGGGDEKRGDG